MVNRSSSKNSVFYIALALGALVLPIRTGASDQGEAGATTQTAAQTSMAAVQAMEAKSFLHHVEVLSSDDFEGRSVGTHGGEVTEQYLVSEFRRLGLAPGNPDGGYVQAVPLSGHASVPPASVHAGGRSLDLHFRDDFVAWSYERAQHVEVKDSELVFAGYGVVAPEYGWDDFKGLDVKGKTLVVLINDPQIPDPKDPSRLDDTMFKGKAMTYYGRWTYTDEPAAAM